MINDQYINEAVRIRKYYLQNLKEIVDQEPIIMKKKEAFQKIQDEMKTIVQSDANDIRKTMDLNEKLIYLEREIKSIQNIIQPFYDKIEKLKDDRDRLYLSIKEKYPNITAEEIKNDISSKLNE
jgi:vacuolar-type H+-ATPase subunit E/Vma4